MSRRTNKIYLLAVAIGVVTQIVTALCCGGCGHRASEQPMLSRGDSVEIIHEITRHRAEVDSFFRYAPESPFRNDTAVHFDSIRWFPPDLGFYFKLKLQRYDHPERVTVMGTKGEERVQLKYGYFEIPRAGSFFRLNVYKEASTTPSPYRNILSVWFTDATTNRETYGVGRYLDVGEESADPEHLYRLDFNAAYNPYCAYSSLYSCAIPRKEDHFDFPLVAGEMKYHP